MATHWTLGCDAAGPGRRRSSDRVPPRTRAEDREERYDDVLGNVVMLDPEGNEFCVG